MLFVRRPEELKEVEQQDVAQMTSACADIATAYELAQGFASMIRQRLSHELEPWLEAAKSAGLVKFRKLAKGLWSDQEAVAAALIYPWSNGQAEGQINQLKLIKRLMYGRANFDLLRHRVLAA